MMIKYSGIAGLLLAVLVIAGTAQGVHRRHVDVLARASAANATDALIARAEVSDEQRHQLAQASTTLKRVQHLPAGAGLTANIIAVPPNSVAGGHRQRPEVVESSVARTYVVSMVFIGAGHRYAVVDDRFCMRGTRLLQGDTVRRIQPGRVLVSMDGVNRWFYVRGAHTAKQASARARKALVNGA